MELSIRAEQKYLNELRDIMQNGVDVKNERTGVVCRTKINVDFEYDASTNEVPLITTRKAPTVLPIAELLGYIRGYTSAKDFRELGCKSWDANANLNEEWLNNPARKGEDDMGLVYGAAARSFETPHVANGEVYKYTQIDLFQQVYENLKSGKDSRGEIITFWNPSVFSLGCLRPCLHTYQFSLLGDDLYLNAFQRSNDMPLGNVANMVQVWLFLKLMAQITNKNPKMAYHKIVNAHIYENQFEGVLEQISREPLEQPTLEINPDIKTLDDVMTWVGVEDFEVSYPEYHPAIKYPFSV